MMMAARSAASKSASSRARQRQRNLFEVGVGQADFFAIAFRLDEADFRRKAVERIAQRGTQTRVLAEIEHRGIADC